MTEAKIQSFDTEAETGTNYKSRLLSRVLVGVWVFTGIVTYLLDAQPPTVFTVVWSVIACFTGVFLFTKIFRKTWVLRFWGYISCVKRGFCCFCGKRRNDENQRHNQDKQTKLLQQLKTVWKLSLPYFRQSRSGMWLFFGMIVLVLMNSGVWVVFSFASKDFYNALNGGDSDAFQDAMAEYALVLFLGAPVVALYSFQRDRLSNDWRKWMTERTLNLYARNRVYYHLEQNKNEDMIDNPDQRIAEDVAYFTCYTVKLLVLWLKDMINMISFSIILFTIAPELFVVLFIYVVCGTLIASCLGSPLIHLNYLQLQHEANFRFSLVRLRENAENVAFYGGEELEVRSLYYRLGYVIRNRLAIICRQLKLELFTNIYFYMSWILPVAIVAPRFFANEIELGVVTQSREAFHNVLNDLSFIVQEFESLSKLSAGVARLGSFYDAIRFFDDERELQSSPLQDIALFTPEKASSDESSSQSSMNSGKPIIKRNSSSECKIVTKFISHGRLLENKQILLLNQLTVLTPNFSRVLIKDLNLTINKGDHLLIVGSSGAGKSSLLRCIAGLWNSGKGMIERPLNESVFFLPQRPYCVTGSLRDQLLYPALSDNSAENHRSAVINIDVISSKVCKYRQAQMSDDVLLGVLNLVKLTNLAAQAGNGDPFKGLDTVQDWGNILSLGEQQRLAFARVFVNRPRLVILDEATSALDMTMEAHMYGLLKTMARANGTVWSDSQAIPFKPVDGLTYISVGHRPSLLAHHKIKLRLAESEHTLLQIDTEAAAKIAADSANLLI